MPAHRRLVRRLPSGRRRPTAPEAAEREQAATEAKLGTRRG
ncbi:hypothetical protein [Kitasatospora sp. NPDC088351]